MKKENQNDRTFNVSNAVAKGVVVTLATVTIAMTALFAPMSKPTSTVTVEDINQPTADITVVAPAAAVTTVQETSRLEQTETTTVTLSVTLQDVDTNPWATRIGTKYTVSKNDFVELCNLLGREYGADFVPIEEKAQVIQTVMNRVESPYFPGNVKEVIAQPKQYEGDLSRGYYSPQVTESVKLAVLYCLNGNLDNKGYVFYWGDGIKNHFYTYDEYEDFASDLNTFKASK